MSPTQPKVDIETRVDQYVKLRDMIKEISDRHRAEIKPYVDALEALNATLLDHINTIGAESVKTAHGTVYRLEKKSATIADKTAFWSFVVATGEFDLLDYKANPVAVKAFIDKQVEAGSDQITPPGINYTTRYEVGVRRK